MVLAREEKLLGIMVAVFFSIEKNPIALRREIIRTNLQTKCISVFNRRTYPFEDGLFSKVGDGMSVEGADLVHRQWGQLLPAIHSHNHLVHSQTLVFLNISITFK